MPQLPADQTDGKVRCEMTEDSEPSAGSRKRKGSGTRHYNLRDPNPIDACGHDQPRVAPGSPRITRRTLRTHKGIPLRRSPVVHHIADGCGSEHGSRRMRLPNSTKYNAFESDLVFAGPPVHVTTLAGRTPRTRISGRLPTTQCQGDESFRVSVWGSHCGHVE